MRRAVTVIFALISALPSTLAWADDWPQYRADCCRSGYTAEALPDELTLAWVHQPQHAPRPAWVGRSLARSRMRFDWAYSVVATDGQCLFGSSADDKVVALDAATGGERWSYFTGGPVRLAPAVWQDRLFVGSDDGCLHCLDVSDGGLLWKLRGGPRNDRVVGNGRLVSRWVVRGGPAVRDGVVYFAAGIWPLEGVYIYAVDAAAGRVLWCNDHTGYLEIDQPHMVCHSRGGVAAQGYLAVTDKYLFVPTGRSVPAVFDRETGRLLHFHLSRYGGKTPWGTGGGDVVATGDVFFNAGMAFDSPTGLRYRDVGLRRWWERYRTPDGRTPHGEFLWGERQQISVTPEGFVRSEGARLCRSALSKKTYDAKREAPTARATPRLPTVGRASDKHHLERIDDAPFLKDVWQLPLPVQPEAMIVAGDCAVWGADGRVAIVDLDRRETIWSAKVDGVVRSLAVAEGRLLVSTDRGTIYGFAAPTADARPRRVSAVRRSLAPEDEAVAQTAASILKAAEVSQGFCLVVDCGDGSLAYELARQSELSVVALAENHDEAERARRRLDAWGVYGVRVAVLRCGVEDLPEYFANLIVSDRPRDDLERILRPCGGVVGTVSGDGIETRVRGALPGGGQWTHNLGDAGNILDSGDTIVRGPLGMLWYADETQETIDRHGKNPAPLFYQGLILREGIDGIRCLDGYNGTLRWEVELPGVLAAYREGTQVGGGQIGSTFCVDDDTVFVRIEDRCLALDVFSGREIARFRAPPKPDGTRGRWGYVAAKDGLLFGSLMNESYVIKAQHGDGGERTQKPMEDHLTESSLLFALNAQTGRLRWTFDPAESIRNNAIAVGDGVVYVIDRPAAEIDKHLKPLLKNRRRGVELPGHPTGVLLALDAQTGEVRWRDDDEVFGTTLSVSTKHDVLLMSYCRIGFTRPSDWPTGMRGYRASDGTRLWESSQSGMRPTIVDRTIYSFPMAWDLLTGEQRTLESPRPGERPGQPWRIRGKGQGCGLVAGCENLLLIRSGALGYYDTRYDRGWMENYGGLRTGCFVNALPVGGIVVAPDDTRACRCSYQNQASIALIQRGFRAPEIDAAPGQNNVRYGRHLKEPVFTGSLLVTITHEDPRIEIRYTLDDSYPTAQSPRYTEPFRIDETTPVRAAALLDGRVVAERDVVIFTRVARLEGSQQHASGAQRRLGEKQTDAARKPTNGRIGVKHDRPTRSFGRPPPRRPAANEFAAWGRAADSQFPCVVSRSLGRVRRAGPRRRSRERTTAQRRNGSVLGLLGRPREPRQEQRVLHDLQVHPSQGPGAGEGRVSARSQHHHQGRRPVLRLVHEVLGPEARPSKERRAGERYHSHVGPGRHLVGDQPRRVHLGRAGPGSPSPREANKGFPIDLHARRAHLDRQILSLLPGLQPDGRWPEVLPGDGGRC
jgi:outer membrane protein assembly factor BamB